MFVVGRAILGSFCHHTFQRGQVLTRIGLGASGAAVAAAVYLTETFSAAWRPWGVAILQNFY